MRETVAAKIHDIAEAISPQPVAQIAPPDLRQQSQAAIETIQRSYDQIIQDVRAALEHRRIRGVMLEEAVLKFEEAVQQRSDYLINLLNNESADIDELMVYLARLAAYAGK
jgi:hypothetical protein